MTTAIKRRRGTTTQHSTFTGLEGEITIDTTKDTAVVHDGATAGGRPLLREDLANNAEVVTKTGTQTLTNKALNGTLGATTPSTVVATSVNSTTGITNTASGGTSAVGITNTSSAISYITSNGAATSGAGGVFSAQRGGTALGWFATASFLENSNNSTDVGIGASTGGSVKLYTNNSSTASATIDSSGNVGIGVTPSAWATYKATQVGWSALAGYAGADTAVFSNAFYDGGYKYIGNGFASQYRQINSSHQFFIAPSGTAGNAITFTQAMTLDASGNLGIGTTSSSARLAITTVPTTSTPNIQFAGNNGGGTVQNLSGLQYYHNLSSGLVDSTFVYGNTTNSYFAIGRHNGTAYAEQLRLHNSGGVSIGNTTDAGATNLSVTGTGKFGTTVAVGAATPSASGAGITFPATQSASTDANTLDDYEEGTWTPNQSAGLTVVGAFSSAGTYTKVGRLVTVGGKIAGATSIALAAAGEISSNLPFTTLYATHDFYMGSSTNANNTISSSCLSYSTSLYGTTAIAATAAIYFTVTYMV